MSTAAAMQGDGVDVDALRRAVREKLASAGVAKRLRADGNAVDPARAVRALEEDGTLASIIAALSASPDTPAVTAAGVSAVSPGAAGASSSGTVAGDAEGGPVVGGAGVRRVHVEVLGGRAFSPEELPRNVDVDEADLLLAEEEDADGDPDQDAGSLDRFVRGFNGGGDGGAGPASTAGRGYLCVSMQHRGSRFSTRPTPCARDPDLTGCFAFPFEGGLEDPEPLRIAVTHASARDGPGALLGTHILDPRRALVGAAVAAGAGNLGTCLSLEIRGHGARSGVPVGVIDVRISAHPRPGRAVSAAELDAQRRLERTQRSHDERGFYTAARGFWRDYTAERASHGTRLVKIFATAEDGVSRPVCAFVRPLRCARALGTARRAARFVSLVPLSKGLDRVDLEATAGTGCAPWRTQHAFLAQGSGTLEDHALLLCSLLLGLGLNAFVALGVHADSGAHAWVVTISPSPERRVVFWESATGARYAASAGRHRYRAVHCLFNHESLYANASLDDSVSAAVFDLADASRWRALPEDAIRAACQWAPVAAPLALHGSDPSAHPGPIAIERRIRDRICAHRARELGAGTVFDDHLSGLLLPALEAYENERCTGVSVGGEEFRDAVRGAVPAGATFKAFPIMFNHGNSEKMLDAMLASEVGREIVRARGGEARFAVAAKVFPFPERCHAVWVMVAVRHVQQS